MNIMSSSIVTMSGRELAEKAISLLGYAESNGNTNLPDRIKKQAVALLNVIYSDLWRVTRCGSFEPITALDDDVSLPERALNDVMPYGVAMVFAQSEGDNDNQQLWASLYNAKRASLSRREQHVNVIPWSDDL